MTGPVDLVAARDALRAEVKDIVAIAEHLAAEVAELRAALGFYADHRNHEAGRVATDLGERARQALDGKGGP